MTLLPARPFHHVPSATLTAALAVAGALVLTACAGDPVTVPGAPATTGGDPDSPVTSGPDDSGTSSAAPTAPPGDPVAADLTVSVDDGTGVRAEYTLTCEPVGGDHPDAEGACAALAAAGTGVFGPVPKDQMCTEIYGGPQTAVVAGTLAGQPVTARFSRTNGCEISRWDALSAVFGPVGSPDS